MHALLALTSLLLAVLAGHLVLRLLRRPTRWPHRRDLQLIVLAVPLISLGVAIGGLHHFLGQTCFLTTPPWDYTAGLAVTLVIAAAAFGGLALGLIRFVTMSVVTTRRTLPAGPEVQEMTHRIAERMGTSVPLVSIVRASGPLAVTVGARRPTVLRKPRRVGQREPREQEAVQAHDISQVLRADAFVTWLATILRDAFFYLPTTREAYRQFRHEKELACDDLAVGVTKRPLALASALAKVWQQAVEGHRFGLAETLVESHRPIEGRIERLLGNQRVSPVRPPGEGSAAAIGLQAVGGLVALTTATVAVLLTPMGCGLGSMLGRL